MAVITPPVSTAAEILAVAILAGLENEGIAHRPCPVGVIAIRVTGRGELSRRELGEAEQHVVGGIYGDRGIGIPFAPIGGRGRRVFNAAALHDIARRVELSPLSGRMRQAPSREPDR